MTNRRDFFKSISLAIGAFAAYMPPIPETTTQPVTSFSKSLKCFWTLDAKENVREVQDELGVTACVISNGWKIKITRTSFGPAEEPEPLQASDLSSLCSRFGLPDNLSNHLKGLGLNKFLAHERRLDWSKYGPKMEQDWVTWLDPELTDKLCTSVVL